MNSLKEIRDRDSESADTWFRTPAVGACGQAFIDRRWLLAEVDRLAALLSGIRNDALVWAMSCPHDCPACDAMYEVIKSAGHPGADCSPKQASEL